MKKLITSILLVVIGFSGMAQKAKPYSFALFSKEYAQLMKLQPVENYKVTITNSFYTNSSDKEPNQVVKAQLTVLKDGSYAYAGTDRIQIQEAGLRLDIDTVAKRVILSKSKQETELMGFQRLENLDSANYKVTRLVANNKTVYEIIEQKQTSQYHITRFIFDAKTNRFLCAETVLWPGTYQSEDLNYAPVTEPKITYSYGIFETVKNQDPENQVWNWIDGSNGVYTIRKEKNNYQLFDIR